LRRQNQLDCFTDRSQAARIASLIMNVPAQQWMAVAYAHRQPCAFQDGQIHQVVPHVAHCRIRQPGIVQNGFVRLKLLEKILADEVNAQLSNAVLNHRRVPSRNDPAFQSRFVRDPDAQAVARMESFGFNKPSLWRWHKVDASVGENSIDVHKEKLHVARALPNLSGWNRHVGSYQQSALISHYSAESIILSPSLVILSAPKNRRISAQAKRSEGPRLLLKQAECLILRFAQDDRRPSFFLIPFLLIPSER
jgi:hypothetical protein